jgi:hypothetical protein
MNEMWIIQQLAMRIDDKKFPFQMARSFIYNWECDYWTMTQGGETREFEIKISRGDYFKDQEKDKHKTLNGANFFYYVCPKDLIKKSEVDRKYGLMYVWDTGFIEVVKKPQRLNSNLFTNWQALACKWYWKFRDLWKEKYIKKAISKDEYYKGLKIDFSPE